MALKAFTLQKNKTRQRMVKAVLTGDVENSTDLSAAELQALLGLLREELGAAQAAGKVENPAFYRGDSFQLIVTDPATALDLALALKTRVQFGMEQEGDKTRLKTRYDVAISVGIGELSIPEDLRTAHELPFRLSGRGLDELKKNKRTLGVFTGNEAADAQLDALLFLYDWIMQQWTVAGAEVVYQKLQGLTEQEIAERLGISQSAANQRSRASCWNGWKKIQTQYVQLLEATHG